MAVGGVVGLVLRCKAPWALYRLACLPSTNSRAAGQDSQSHVVRGVARITSHMIVRVTIGSI